jgi:hypothetical protein
MKKQTAVEWLYSELSKNNISNDSIKSRIYKESEILNQAIAMEKEQIMDAYENGETDEFDPCDFDSGKKYYTSTFGS